MSAPEPASGSVPTGAAAPATPAVAGSREAPLALSRVAEGIVHRLSNWPQMWLTGELMDTPARRGTSVFLNLADPAAPRGRRPAQLTAVVDTPVFDALPVTPGKGDRVVALVRLSFWATSGKVAATVRDLHLAGDGAILERIAVLRAALAAEGLFDPARKKPLPSLPAVIGLITGAGTHAEADVVTRTTERWPQAQFRTVHVPVQGKDCPPAVAAAVRALDADPLVEVIVIARGGGSVSDLAWFSDEQLVRTVAAVRTPVVSAIGHEPDRPILDDVADARAGTPTQAAALVVADVAGEDARIGEATARIGRRVREQLDLAERSLASVLSRPVMRSPLAVLDAHRDGVEVALARAERALGNRLGLAEQSLASAAGTLSALSPLRTLERGYAIVLRADGSPVGDVATVEAGTGLDVRLLSGRLAATVTSTSSTSSTPGGTGTAGQGEQPTGPGGPSTDTSTATASTPGQGTTSNVEQAGTDRSAVEGMGQ